MGNAKTALQYLHHPSNWRPFRVKLCMICLSHRKSFLQKSLGMRTNFRIIVLTFFATKLICITIYTKQTVARESKTSPLISVQNNDRFSNKALLEFASKSISLHALQCFLVLECLCRLTKTFIKKTLIVFFWCCHTFLTALKNPSNCFYPLKKISSFHTWEESVGSKYHTHSFSDPGLNALFVGRSTSVKDAFEPQSIRLSS